LEEAAHAHVPPNSVLRGYGFDPIVIFGLLLLIAGG
jgi:hypothetical protein